MTNIIVVFPKIEEARSIRILLMKGGFTVTGVCTTGIQAVNLADELNDGIVVCGYKMPDMLYSELREFLPEGIEMLLLAAQNHLNEDHGDGVVCLGMPLKVHDLLDTVGMLVENLERRRRKKRSRPKERNPEEQALIKEAKSILMERNHMSEEEAHRYIQKCSMDSGTNLVETAQMVLTMMQP